MPRIGVVTDVSSAPAQFNTSGVTNGQSLVYNASTGLWVPGTGSGGGGAVSSVFNRTGAVVAQNNDYSASQVANAADKASASVQAFNAPLTAAEIRATLLTGATGSYVGVTASGPPLTGTFVLGDWCTDQTGARFTCTTAGSPGTWTQEPGTGGGGGGSVSSVFNRTGAVVAQNNDYAVSQVNGAAPLASPTFTGTPTAPTPVAGNNSTAIATTAFVAGTIGAPGPVLVPSGDTSGVTDDANFNAAVTSLNGVGGNPAGGTIFLKGDFNKPFYTAAGWVLPAQTVSGVSGAGPVCLEGIGMPVLFAATNAASPALYNHRTSTYSGGTVQHYPCSTVRNLVVDGSNTTGAQIGIDVGDGNYFTYENVVVQNYTGPGAIGFYQSQYVFWTEKCDFHIRTWNCTYHVVIDCVSGTGGGSHEYCLYDIYSMGQTDQVNFLVQGGANIAGRGVYLFGNYSKSSQTTGSAPTNMTGPKGVGTVPSSVFAIVGSSKVYNTAIWVKLEQNSGGTGNSPYAIYMDTGTNEIQNCSGAFDTGTGAQGTQVNGNICSFRGNMNSAALPGWPANAGMGAVQSSGGSPGTVPTTGTEWINEGSDVIIQVAGAGVTAVKVCGNHNVLTGAGWVLVPAGGSMTINYTSTPTLTFSPFGAGLT